ncbi:hypothetical protein C1N73_27885 (plasmid) [Priestia aryabhattai]
MRKLFNAFIILLAVIGSLFFSSTASASSGEFVLKKTTLDQTKGVSITTKVYIKTEEKKNVEYYSIKKVTGTVKLLDGRTYIKGIKLRIGQNGSYSGKPIATQTKYEDIKAKNFFSFTSYPVSTWKPVAKTGPWSVVGSSATLSLQRGNSKWSFNHINNLP